MNGSIDKSGLTPNVTSNSPGETQVVIETVALLVLMIGILFGNGLVCTAFLTERKLRTTTNSFVVSLACSDLLVGLVVIPLYLVTRYNEYPIHHPTRRVWVALEMIGCSSSILSLVVISLERCLSVKFPAIHRNLTRKYTYMGILFVWFYAIFVSGALMDVYIGVRKDTWIQLYKCIMPFFLPLAVIIFSYTIIFRVAIMRTKSHNNKLARELRIALTISIVVGVFVCCWLPFFLLSLISIYHQKKLDKTIDLPLAVIFVKWLQFVNSGVNPIIYAYVNQEFRQRFRKMLPCCICLKKKRQPMTASSGRARASSHLDSKTEMTSLKATHV